MSGTFCFYFTAFSLVSNSSLLYLKLTLSSFIPQDRFSQRKEVGDCRESKRGALEENGTRKRQRDEERRRNSFGTDLETRARKVGKEGGTD